MTRLYRFALRMLPRGFREHYARDMEAAFGDALRGKRGLARFATFGRALADIPSALRMLRAEERRDGPRASQRHRRPWMMESFIHDIALGLRALVKRPGFAALALLTLALGIGAVTAVFSVVNGVLLKPLPYDGSDRIVILWHDLGNGAQTLPALHPLDYYDYRERGRGFDNWTLATGNRRILAASGEEPAIVDVGYVEHNFLPFFGIEPFVGRHFEASDDVPGGPKVAILSHRLWRGRFGSDPGVIGRTVTLGSDDREIVGVVPPSFRLELPAEAFRLRDADVWVPVQIDRDRQPPRNYTGYTAFAKLAPGVSFEQAQQEMDRLEAQLKEEHAVHEAANLQVRAVPLHGDVVKGARPALYVLLTAVGLVLLIACGNTAQLLLTRWRGGERELSVRAAMGASRLRLTRLVVLESAVLALLAGAMGVAVAWAGVALVRRIAVANVPRIAEVSVDGTVLAFALGISLSTAFLFSLVPAVTLSRSNLAAALAESGRSTSSARQARLRTSLIVCEVALSVVLLVATGLSIRSFQVLLDADPGFESEGLLTLHVSLPSPRFDEEAVRRTFHETLRERIAALPGVVSMAQMDQLPLTGSGRLQPYAYDEATATNWESVTADERSVTPGFFRAMGATLLAGREFTDDDLRLERAVAVIDEQLAERAFPGQSALGRQIRVEPLGSEDPFVEIVGVTAHLKLHDLTRAALPQFYFPMDPRWNFSLVVRTTQNGNGNGRAVASRVRDELRALAPGAAIEDVRPMDALVSEARAPARLSLGLMVGFGALALVLAAVGLFGVVAYSVSTRRVELGIRMAVGASPTRIRRAVLGEGLRLVGASSAIGLGAAALLGQWLSGLGVLHGVDPLDFVTFAGVVTAVPALALAACWVPARRATRVDTALVLKSS